jgi:hypothetical protein
MAAGMTLIIWRSCPALRGTKAFCAWLRAHGFDPAITCPDMVITAGEPPQLHVSQYQLGPDGRRVVDHAADPERLVTVPRVVPLLYAPPVPDQRPEPEPGSVTDYQLTEHDVARIHMLRGRLMDARGMCVRVGPDVTAGMTLPARLTHALDGPYVEVDLSGLPNTDPRVRYRRRYTGLDRGHLVLAD